jgi:hypothetical protein
MTSKPFKNLAEEIPDLYKKAQRQRNTQAKKVAPGAPRVAVARNVLAWLEQNAKRLNASSVS